MAKFANTKTLTRGPVAGVIQTVSQVPDTITYEGAPAFSRTAKSELFLLAVTNMVGENTFYESAESRDARFESLIHTVVAEDPEWVARFIPYLRNTLNMRTASIVMAAEYVKAGGPNGRKVVDAALQRADEPSVMVAYWAHRYGTEKDGRKVPHLPMPIKRGVADAVLRLYNEKSFIKWDSDKLTPRFGDVVQLVHPKAMTPWQHDLFRYAMSKRYNREDLTRDTENLSTVKRFRELMALPVEDRRKLVDEAAKSKDFSALEGAGLTWENLSGWLQGPMDAAAWEAIIPQMLYMATLRNLRNFDDAGISAEARDAVIKKLTDPDEVKASRQMPIRFYSAYKNVTSVNYTSALEKALDMTLVNIPQLDDSLILVDVSGSMYSPLSGGNTRSWQHSGEAKTPQRWEVAALFGSAVALRGDRNDLVWFGTDSGAVDYRKGGSVLRLIEKLNRNGGGTNTWQAVTKHFKPDKHRRVLIITDEQAHYGTAPDLGNANLYIFNVAGYQQGLTSSGGKAYTFGGLSDNAFAAIEAIESLRDESWPF